MASVTPDVTPYLSPGQSRATTPHCTGCEGRALATGGPGPRARRSWGGPGCWVDTEEVARRRWRSRRRSWRRGRAAPPVGCREKNLGCRGSGTPLPQTSAGGSHHHHHRGRRPQNSPTSLRGGEGGGGGGPQQGRMEEGKDKEAERRKEPSQHCFFQTKTTTLERTITLTDTWFSQCVRVMKDSRRMRRSLRRRSSRVRIRWL